MTNRERESEMFGELAEAVFAADHGRAVALLEEMQRLGLRGETIRRARRRAEPERYPPAPPLAQADVRPWPGARPGDFEPRLPNRRKLASAG